MQQNMMDTVFLAVMVVVLAVFVMLEHVRRMVPGILQLMGLYVMMEMTLILVTV